MIKLKEIKNKCETWRIEKFLNGLYKNKEIIDSIKKNHTYSPCDDCTYQGCDHCEVVAVERKCDEFIDHLKDFWDILTKEQKDEFPEDFINELDYMNRPNRW